MEQQEYNLTPEIPQEQSVLSQDQASTPNKKKGFWWFMHTHHTFCFSMVILAIVIIMSCFLWCSNSNLRSSQSKIIEVFEQTQKQTEANIRLYIQESAAHREALQSCVDKQMKLLAFVASENTKDSTLINISTLFVKLEADIKILEEQNNTITKLATDSLTRKYESMMSNIISEKMLELHLAKIEHEYTNITIWAAILTIVFLIFSFFSLFKIEQSRKEIEDLARDGRDKFEGIIRGDQIRKEELEGSITAYKAALDGLYNDYKAKFGTFPGGGGGTDE